MQLGLGHIAVRVDAGKGPGEIVDFNRHRTQPRSRRHRLIAWLFAAALSCVCVASVAFAAEHAEPAHPGDKTLAQETSGAPIVVWNRRLFVLRAPYGNVAPAERAAAARQRIAQALDTLKPDDISSTWIESDAGNGVLIRAGTLVLFGILPADVDGDRAATEEAGQRVVTDLREILQTRATAMRLPKLLRGIGVSALALLAFAAIVLAIARARRRMHARIAAIDAGRAQGAAGRVFDMRPIAWGLLRMLVDFARLATTLALAYITLSLILRQFPYTRPWGTALGRYIIDAITTMGDAFVASIPSLAMLVVIWLITRGLVRIVSAWFNAIESSTIESEWLDPQAASATRRLITIAIWLFAMTIAYPYIPGSETAAFKGISVFVGLMLSLGSAGVLNQVVSGFVVLYSRAIRVGDFVRVGEKEGTVRELGLLSLKMVTRLNEEITVPNAVLAGTLVENFTRQSREQGLLVSTTVTIGYDAPWRQVHALLELAAARTPNLLGAPKPFVLQSALSDFYTHYQLHAAIARPQDRPFVMSRLHAEIQDAFNEFGVQIMSPNFEMQPDGKVWVPREHWHEAPAEKPRELPG